MKNAFLLLSASSFLLCTACNSNQNNSTANDSTVLDSYQEPKSKVVAGSYINLANDNKVYIIEDTLTGIAIDSASKIPVEFYYDPVSKDTLYQTGMVVNHLLIKEKEGKYKLDDTKIKIDGDEIKVKTDSSKLKIDSNQMKMKSLEGKTKIDDDGAMKSK